MEVEPESVVIGTSGLTAAEVVRVARRGAHVTVGDDAGEALARSAAIVEDHAASDEPVYGISTGFGSLANTAIPPERREELQRGLIRSHAAGMGPLVEPEVVRAMMLLRARTLAMGYSGVRPVVVDTIVALLNAGITPEVHEHGSLGASGDLAPLAHVALALIGEGECAPALAAAGIEPLTLRAKEGLALINGTDGMLGMLVLALADLHVLVRAADITAAMSVEALLGTDRAFAEDLMALRPHPGQTASAANLRRLLADSPIVASHRTDDPRVQDAYSLRCTPQVHGAARDTVAHARGWPTSSCARPSTTRPCCPTAGSSPAATSTAPPSASPATSSPSPPPRSGPSPSAGPTASSTSPAPRACPRSWSRTPG